MLYRVLFVFLFVSAVVTNAIADDNSGDNIQTVEIIGDKNVCLSKSYTYMCNAGSAAKYNWTISGGKIIGSVTASAVDVEWTKSGSGYISVKTISSTNKIDSLKFPVNVAVKETFSIKGSFSTCQNSNERYFISNPKKIPIKWRPINGLIVGSNSQDTTEIKWIGSGVCYISVIATNENGCFDTTIANVAVSAMSIPVLTGGTSVCTQTKYEYRAEYRANTEYKWSARKGTIVGDDNTTLVNIRWDSVGQGEVYLKVTSMMTHCSAQNSLLVSISELPDINFDSIPEYCYTTSDIIINSGKPEGGFYTGSWMDGNHFQTFLAGAGTYIITYNYLQDGCLASLSRPLVINPLPSVPQIFKIDTILMSTGKFRNQWYLDGVKLPADTNQKITPKKNGSYTVQSISEKGCLSNMSEPYIYDKLDVSDYFPENLVFSEYRNGSLRIDSPYEIYSVSIYDYLGQQMFISNPESNNGKIELGIGSLPNGYYFIQITNSVTSQLKKLLINQ